MKNPLARLASWFRFRRENYRCSKCGYVFPKKDAPFSGWKDHPYGFHVHCPNCDAVVDQFIKKSE